MSSAADTPVDPPTLPNPALAPVVVDYIFNIILVGDSGVGKSCLLHRLSQNSFADGSNSTIGVDFKTKVLQVDGANVKLQIWDTGGQERFRAVTSTYYRSAHAILLVYDLTSPITFSHIREHWIPDIDARAPADSVRVVIANKLDVATMQRSIPAAYGEELAEFVRARRFLEVSARSGENVTQVFEELVRVVKDRVDKGGLVLQDPQGKTLQVGKISKGNTSVCAC